MKSRKLSKQSKAKKCRSSKTLKSRLRNFETLEERRLLTASPWSDGLYYSESLLSTARLTPDITRAEYVRRAQESAADSSGSGSSGSLQGEGMAGSLLSVSEIEPNGYQRTAQYLPLGTAAGKHDAVTVIGTMPSSGFDYDYFAVDLSAGDILDAKIEAGGGTWDLSIRDGSDNEIAATTAPVTPGDYPSVSPLSTDGQSSLAIVIPHSGRYHIRVGDGNGAYDLELRTYRPVMEAEPVGTRQILFLDFDGQDIRREIFDPTIPGTARLSPLSNFLAGWNLDATDENAVIDSIIENVAFRFNTEIARTGTNGGYSVTGRAGQFDLEIRNSRDHADPFGLENVSRMIVGGSANEFGLGGFYGIAESNDIGNFDQEESGVVLLGALSAPGAPAVGPAASINQIPIGGQASKVDLIGEVVGNIVAHEAGHFFGLWHTLNVPYQTISVGAGVEEDAGVGPDGIYGTDDDTRVTFGTGTYDPATSGIPIGRQFSAETLSWVLSTGTTGGAAISGRIYEDTNLSRSLDSGDRAGPQALIWSDANKNSVLDSNEFFTRADGNGNFYLALPAGLHDINVETVAGWRSTTSPVAGVNLAVGASQVLNFGFERLDTSFTGVKWNDSNANGQRDEGESPIPGVWVYIDLDGDDRIDIGEPAAQTDAHGRYSVDFPGPGTYAIREVVASGYVQTFPGPENGFEHIVTLTGDPVLDASAAAGLNFGNTLTVDFGDAPSSYGVAEHGFLPALRLGANWDAEQSSQFSVDATGDDTNGSSDGSGNVIDDEDGVTLARPLVRGSSNNRVSVTAANNTGASAFLNAWIDFNQNGVFDSNEQIFDDAVVATGTSTLTFAAPADAALGDTIARFRYSTTPNVAATGAAEGGEVEDYLFNVVPTLEIAVDDTATVARNSVLNEINVLENDFKLPGETLQLVSLSSTSAGGSVSISANNTVLYTPAAGFVGNDSFTYTVRNSGGDIDTATVSVEVRLIFDNPLAVDDSFDVSTDAVDFPLNVLANDIEGQSGALTIISTTQPDKGGRISIATGGKSLRYTPLRSFGGTEFFTYTVADSAGNQSTAQVTLHTLPGDRADDEVLIQLVARNEAGTVLSKVPQGTTFYVDVLVDDLRYSESNPSSAAGVFAAYTDLLYNLQLVSTVTPDSGPFNFDVEFFNEYLNGQRGDATVPGIIDEFGAFTDLSTMNEPDPIRLASIAFEARAPGIADFTPDPADLFPASDTILFDSSAAAVPVEQIRYIGTSIEIVGDGAEFPLAVDDSIVQALPAGSIEFPIDVLANDLPGSTGSISIVDFDSSTLNGGSVALNATGDRLLYTPRSDLNGTDQFTYTIEDTRGIESTATVTVRVGTANPDVALRLEVTDTSGAPIDQVTVGSQFQLRGYVQDVRAGGANRGIFAAYQDVLFSSNLVSAIASDNNDPDLGFQVTFGPNYQNVRDGDIDTAGLLNEIGAVQTGEMPLGSEAQLMFVVTMTANSPGLAEFTGDPADIMPLHDTLTYDPVASVPFDKIAYGFDSVMVVSAGGGGGSGEGFHNYRNALDVNDDGFISPIDALGVINRLNLGGDGSLSGGEGEPGDSMLYIDTNNDGYVSPLDALLVINHLNSPSLEGEGEGSSELDASLIPVVSATKQVSQQTPVADGQPSQLSGGSIGIRMTGTSYGPQPQNYADSVDQAFDDAAIDSAIDEIASSVEENWKLNL